MCNNQQIVDDLKTVILPNNLTFVIYNVQISSWCCLKPCFEYSQVHHSPTLKSKTNWNQSFNCWNIIQRFAARFSASKHNLLCLLFALAFIRKWSIFQLMTVGFQWSGCAFCKLAHQWNKCIHLFQWWIIGDLCRRLTQSWILTLFYNQMDKGAPNAGNCTQNQNWLWVRGACHQRFTRHCRICLWVCLLVYCMYCRSQQLQNTTTTGNNTTTHWNYSYS